MASGNQQQACHLGYPSFCVVAVPSLSCVQFFCDLMECSPLGSSVHGISQVRILVWVAISCSRGSSQPRDQTQVSCIAGGFFAAEPAGKPTLPLTHQYLLP